MTDPLDQAISRLIAETIERGGVLDVAVAAERLATEHGGDSEEISAKITEAGIAARINMKMDTPKQPTVH